MMIKSKLSLLFLLLVTTACPPQLAPKKRFSYDEYLPFYYSFMIPGGVSQIYTDVKIKFKGTYDSSNANVVSFIIEPNQAFAPASNKVGIVMWAGNLDESTLCAGVGGVNAIDCLFRKYFREEATAQTACGRPIGGVYNPENFVKYFDEFAGQFSRINLSGSEGALFDIPQFFTDSGDQRYSHALFIPNFQNFCAGNDIPGQHGACVGDDGFPASSCYYAADLPEIPALVESLDNF